jgi:nitrogen fixation protein NifB
VKAVRKKLDNLSVVGIAGPGDPFANPEETMETLRLIRKEFPDLLLCVSSNGLNIEPYIEELEALGTSHVTLTINSLDPDVLAKIYSWVRYKKKVYRGVEGAKILLEQQFKSLKKLKAHNIIVKINTIIIPGINDHAIEELSKTVSELGADMMNCIPMYPTSGSNFEDIEEPPVLMVRDIRGKVSKYITPMLHCARCRADAVGLLGKDDKESGCMIREFSLMPEKPGELRDKVAVATYEDMLVNQHLGEATKLTIFNKTETGYEIVEHRPTPKQGLGDERWLKLGNILSDCKALLVSGVGHKPSRILKRSGLEIIQMTGLITSGLDAVYNGTELRTLKKADMFKCGAECKGNATGCG